MNRVCTRDRTARANPIRYSGTPEVHRFPAGIANKIQVVMAELVVNQYSKQGELPQYGKMNRRTKGFHDLAWHHPSHHAHDYPLPADQAPNASQQCTSTNGSYSVCEQQYAPQRLCTRGLGRWGGDFHVLTILRLPGESNNSRPWENVHAPRRRDGNGRTLCRLGHEGVMREARVAQATRSLGAGRER